MKEDFEQKLEQQRKDLVRQMQLQKEVYDEKIKLYQSHVESLAENVATVGEKAMKLGLALEQALKQQGTVVFV